MKKFMLRVMPIIMVLLVVVATPVFALNIDNTFGQTNTNGGSPTAQKIVNNVWGTVLLILQILSVAAIVFACVKYMFAGADEKATIKNGLIVLVIGAVLVFGASTVVSLLINVVNEVGQ